MPAQILIPVVLLAFLPTTGLSQDHAGVLGSWEMTMETPRGSVTQTLTFDATEGALAGVISSPRGESPLEEVSLDGGTLHFQVVRSMRGGNTMTQTFAATIEGDEMKGTISGGRGGERPFAATRKTG